MYCSSEYSFQVYETLKFLFFSTEVPPLVYYSHVTAIVITLLFGTFVFLNQRNELATRLLFLLALAFSTLALVDIQLWVQTFTNTLMFLWSFWLTLFLIIFILCYYFLYVFILKKDLPFKTKLFFVFSIIAVESLSATPLNLSYIDSIYCDASENLVFVGTVALYAFLIVIASITLIVRNIKNIVTGSERKAVMIASAGILLFEISFLTSTFTASIINTLFESGDTVFIIEQYGYYGMSIYFAFLAYTIVKYRTFNIKLVSAQALVVALWILIGALLLVVQSPTSRFVASITLTLALFGGYFLIKSVQREVRQREEIEKLAKDLAATNERLKELDKMKSEFVSVASHQLRGPLTSIRGYASMLSEGTYGQVPEKAKSILDKIVETGRFMAYSIEDYLNVSRIEAGSMKYAYSDFNLYDVVGQVVEENRPIAMKKGIVIVSTTDHHEHPFVHADIGKIRQVISNFIDNSIKYTPRGKITIHGTVDTERKRVLISIVDTGVGMNAETLNEIFNKFVRAKDANRVNTAGTGLGLYIAKKMMEEMGGRVWAESEGEGKGSTFYIEIKHIG